MATPAASSSSNVLPTSSMTMASFKKLQPEEFYLAHFEQGSRPDGRSSLTALRPVSISVRSISTADGSAIVKQGETVVVCGVKLELAEPRPEAPDEGFVVPNLELPPLCHSQWKVGAPPEAAQTASNFVMEVVRSSRLIDPKDLCVKESELAWVVYADMICLNYDGNILDVCLKALVAALRTVTVPEVKFKSDDEPDGGFEVNVDDRTPLKVSANPPFGCTIAVFNERLLVDPTEEEERLANATVTVVVQFDEKPGSVEICHLHKPGGVAVSKETLQKCCSLAKKQARQIKKHIDAAAPLAGLACKAAAADKT